MPVYAALLRAINVGGTRKMPMSDLREVLETLGMTSVQTLLQSGNVVFASAATDGAALIAQIEAGIEARFAFHSDVTLRTLDDLRGIVSGNPFAVEQDDPSKRLVMFLSGRPAQAAIRGLRDSTTGPETIQVVGREAFVYYPDGQGRSKLTVQGIERGLKVSATGRNWNTVNKLLHLAECTPDS